MLVWLLVRMHRALGEIGVVFVNHLLHAKVVQQMLGPRWEILSGGNAHGTEGVHTAEANAAIVQRFNDGLLEGIVSTPVGESALDVFNPRFRYALVVDAHGGPTAASQKLGTPGAHAARAAARRRAGRCLPPPPLGDAKGGRLL